MYECPIFLIIMLENIIAHTFHVGESKLFNMNFLM
jgi:hypothetical protein